VHTGRLVPVHPLTKGLQERNARQIIKQVVDRMAPDLPDPLTGELRATGGLMPLSEAIGQIHFPDDWARLTRARQRLGFDEFLYIQLGVLRRRKLWQGTRGYPLANNLDLHKAFLKQLPFAMTGAQERALEEIFADLARPVPMARLLQGDVGSGKTVVAAATMVQAVASGFQAALMAPTEILAEQHYKGLKKILGQVRIDRARARPDDDWRARQDPERLARLAEIQRILGMTEEAVEDENGIRVALLTGSLKGRERDQVLKGIGDGEIDVVIGTHALIQEGVQYQSLGVAVVDEQHRFGVEQREQLKRKGFNPHLLVMTATPIPRSLALTIYGDLDVSILDERPPGRQPIKTRWIKSTDREKAYKHLRKEVSSGRQAFVICPLVEESEKIELVAATEEYERLQQEVFPDLRIGLIHGKLAAREKDAIMSAFRGHEFDILVATSVVEVGIDVPNATTMVIEGAERFGLSQLHQFRGRVGRGVHQSYCILISDKEENEVTKTRLTSMEQTEDGFRLAEIDLELRGPGEFFGRRQSGTPDLKVARLGDTRLLHAARQAAERLLRDDPELARPEHALLRQKMESFWAAMDPEAS
jgi:ATP-dependent DNA helicase RecG